MKKIGILGSTGSIGSQALDIIKEFKEEFELVFISGNSNVDKLILQAKEFSPKYVCLSDNKKQSKLNANYSKSSPTHSWTICLYLVIYYTISTHIWLYLGISDYIWTYVAISKHIWPYLNYLAMPAHI